jgi:hypothetical protein
MIIYLKGLWPSSRGYIKPAINLLEWANASNHYHTPIIQISEQDVGKQPDDILFYNFWSVVY